MKRIVKSATTHRTTGAKSSCTIAKNKCLVQQCAYLSSCYQALLKFCAIRKRKLWFK